MTVSAEPIFIGGQAVYLKFFAMPRNPGEPPRVEGVMTLIGGEGVLTLDALVGKQGIPGEPAPIIRPQWGSPVTEVGDLPNPDTMDATDDGRAWYIDGMWYVFAHSINDYHAIQGSVQGPPGVTPNITVSAELIEAPDPVVYGEIEVDPSGTTTNPHFHIKVPGVPGPDGPSAAIRTAADVDDTDFGLGRFLAVINEDPTRHGYVDLISHLVEKYTIPHNSFIEHTGGEGRFLIATQNIPAKDFDWYPDVNGHMRIQRSGLFSSAAVEIEIRIGITGNSTGETEPLCGLAPYDPSIALLDSVTILNVFPHFSDAGNPDRAATPDSSDCRQLAGNPYTVYVFIHKVSGTGDYAFTKQNAQLRINVERAPD